MAGYTSISLYGGVRSKVIVTWQFEEATEKDYLTSLMDTANSIA